MIIHFGCGKNDEPFIKGETLEEGKDKCCGCYPHKSCIINKELPNILKQIKPFVREVEKEAEERGYKKCQKEIYEALVIKSPIKVKIISIEEIKD